MGQKVLKEGLEYARLFSRSFMSSGVLSSLVIVCLRLASRPGERGGYCKKGVERGLERT